MRKILALFVLLSAGNALKAQDTLNVADTLKNPKIFISGFGGILSETSGLKNGIAECIGAGGALSINNYFFIGAYGLSLTSKHTINDLILTQENDSMYYFGKALRTNFSHAGIWIGAIFFPKKRIHLGISSRFGWGNIHLTESENNSYIYNTNSRLDFTNDKVFVVTPEIELEVAIASWLKCNVGFGYRYVSGVDFEKYKAFKFNSPQFTVGIYFGGFYNKDEGIEIQSEPEPEEE
jgi:hypothetical protein